MFVLLRFFLFSFFSSCAGLDAKQQKEIVKMRKELVAGVRVCVACFLECLCEWCVSEFLCVGARVMCVLLVSVSGLWCMCVRVKAVYVCAREGLGFRV